MHQGLEYYAEFEHDGSKFSVAFAGYDPLSQLKIPSLPHSPQNSSYERSPYPESVAGYKLSQSSGKLLA